MSLSITESPSKKSPENPAASSLQKRKLELCWMECTASIKSLNYFAGRALTIISTTAEARTSRKRARDDFTATRFAKPVLMK
jgi:hypothetical protein